MLINSEELFNQAIEKILLLKKVVIDVETSGLDFYKNKHRLCGVSIGNKNIQFYFPFRHNGNNIDISFLYKLFDIIKSNGFQLLFYNAKFDLKALLFEGIDLRNLKFADVMILMHLYNEEERRPSLKNLGSKYIDPLIKEKDSEFKKFKKKRNIIGFNEFTPEEIYDYACRDVEITDRLYEFVKNKVDSSKFIIQLEHDLIRLLVDIENYGIKINLEYIKKCIDQERAKIEELKDNIYLISGNKFDILSNPQLTEALHKLNIISPLKSEKTGKDIWPDEVLRLIDQPISKLILEYRSRSKTISTYLESYLNLSDDNQIIHTNFNSVGTRTGRFSCTEPPLQTVPRYSISVNENDVLTKGISNELTSHLLRISNELAEESAKGETYLRKCFIPRKGFSFFIIDYIQMEQLIFAECANEKAMILAANNGIDLHDYTAIEILDYNSAKSDVERNLKRQIAKYINFGILYGMGAKSLSKMIKISINDAYQFLNSYHKEFPEIKKYQRKLQNQVESNGFVSTLFGRTRHLEANFSYKGINSVVSGTCADIMKIVMLKLHNFLKDKKSKILLTIHDELLFEIADDEIESILEIRKIMSDFNFKIKLDTSVKYSNRSWGECKKWELKS